VPETQIEQRYTVAGMLRANAEQRPDSTMLAEGSHRSTWSEHMARASRVGQALRSEGLRPGSRVAFLDRNGIAYFETLFGGALGGIVNVAVNWRLAPPEMAGVIDDAGSEVLVVHADYADCLAAMDSPLPSVRRVVVIGDGAALPDEFHKREVAFEDWIADQPDRDPGHVPNAEEVSLQLYTSGTTGLPKGVMLSNRNLSTSASAADDSFRIDESVVSLVAMPLFHIGGSGWALCGMSRGGTSVILRDLDPVRLLRLVETERISHTFVVPAVLMFMLATPEIATTDLSSLREVFYGASPIAEDVLVSCIKTFRCNFTQVYGMTETTGAISALVSEDHDPDGPRSHLLRSAGKPLKAVEFRIVDPDTGDDLRAGSVGELWTRSPYTMLGYWQKPDETLATIDSERWLRTGDAAYMDEDGYLFLHDRIKDMVISGGENVYPAEVENALLSHPAVVDAAVIGVPDDRWGEAVKAIVVRTPNPADDDRVSDEVLSAEIIEHCRERLAHYKCPKSVDFASSLPRNPSGKILKRELREPFWKGRDRKIH
jgi:long-chain acyl-CoA synthetase